jgi:hypothetical protein
MQPLKMAWNTCSYNSTVHNCARFKNKRTNGNSIMWFILSYCGKINCYKLHDLCIYIYLGAIHNGYKLHILLLLSLFIIFIVINNYCYMFYFYGVEAWRLLAMPNVFSHIICYTYGIYVWRDFGGLKWIRRIVSRYYKFR